MIDLRICDATIVDGTGAARFEGIVEVDAGRITAVGDSTGERARRSVDARGRVVAPGFFDLHTHYDAQWFWDPTASSSCWHGITSVLTGNCGFTLAPAGPDDREYLTLLFSQVEGVPRSLLDETLDFSWQSFGEYLDCIRPRLGVNVAAQVGHSALRHRVMGSDSYERAATAGEIERMCAELTRALGEGAIGFSTLQAGFEVGPYEKPIPSQLASHDELRALAAAIGSAGGGLVTVSPYPGGAAIDPDYRELLVDISRATGGAVLWNAFQHRWDQPDGWRDLLDWMERSAAQGAQIYSVAKAQRLDLEFDLKSTRLFVWFPTWHELLALPEEEKKRRLADPALRETLRAEYSEGREAPATMQARERVLHVVESSSRPELAGRALSEIAADRGVPLVDALLDLALADDLETRFVYRGLMNGDENAVREILCGPYCVPGVSDAGAHLDMDCGVDFSGRLLGHFVRDEKLMTLEEAVRRLTSLSAAVLGLNDRGTLARGQAADLVIFDADRIGAGAREWLSDVPGGGRRIVQRAVGVEQVFVNGELLIEAGEHTGALPGQVLTR